LPEFSPAALAVIGAFARDMGLPAVTRADAPVSFEFSHWGILTLMMAEDSRRVMIFLERAPYFGQAARERRLLARAGLDPARGWFLHAGLADDGSLICFIGIEEEKFDIIALDAALNHLVAELDAVE
jgi:hypothetical protein